MISPFTVFKRNTLRTWVELPSWQDAFDHDKGQKSAISGHRLHWIIFCLWIFSSGSFHSSPGSLLGNRHKAWRKSRGFRPERKGRVLSRLWLWRLIALVCAANGQISFKPGFGAYQSLAQKIKVPFSRIFSFFLQFWGFEGVFKTRAKPRYAPNCPLSWSNASWHEGSSTQVLRVFLLKNRERGNHALVIVL